MALNATRLGELYDTIQRRINDWKAAGKTTAWDADQYATVLRVDGGISRADATTITTEVYAYLAQGLGWLNRGQFITLAASVVGGEPAKTDPGATGTTGPATPASSSLSTTTMLAIGGAAALGLMLMSGPKKRRNPRRSH